MYVPPHIVDVLIHAPVFKVCVVWCVGLQERVQAAGGTVLNNCGLRVMGILQCTRAIGDKDLRQYGVIPTPDVLSLPRTGQEEFLVLATDGLWDVVTNEVRPCCTL
jgi:serine/threonine protein phosphatase PrpC